MSKHLLIPASVETHADSARVDFKFENLGLEATKTAFDDISGVLNALAEQVVQTLDQIVPHLAAMQALLSQRGSARKKILKQAGLPSWSEYGGKYATKLACSFRTIQDHITGLRRNGRSGPSQSAKNQPQSKRNNGTKRSKPWHAGAKDSRALAEAQLAINEVIAAYESGADLEPAIQRYKQVAVCPVKLNAIFEAAASDTAKADVDSEVRNKLVPVVRTAERYIHALEKSVYSTVVTLTEEQKKMLKKPMEDWRSILRYARGLEAEKKGSGVSVVERPVVLWEAA